MLAVRVAHAEEPSTEATEPAAAPIEVTTPVELEATAPDPGGSVSVAEARGVAIEEATPFRDRLRWIPRVLWFVPRWTFWTITRPVKLGMYAYEKYQLRDRVKGVLFNVDGTYGVYPVGSYSTDFGFDFGARFVHKNLFGEGERLKLRANFGGHYRQGYGMTLSSGERFGRVSTSIEAIYERRPNERFFGIGNANEPDDGDNAVQLDPSLADAAVSSRFRQDWFRGVLRVGSRIAGPLSIRLSGALALREFGAYTGPDAFDPEEPDDADDNQDIERRFDTSKLVGYDRGVDNVYVETELVYDSRRQSGPLMSRAVDTTGWYITGHVGRAFGVRGDPTAFTRYGGEIQRLFDLYQGTRVLTLRVMADAVAGGDGRTDDTISFIDLPRLGGSDFLRGYAEGRFRDRAVTLATVEYGWDLGNFLGAYLFADLGRAWKSLADVDASGLHAGYGGGIQLHSYNDFIMRGQLALSREGDFYFQFVFAPAFGRRERAGRY